MMGASLTDYLPMILAVVGLIGLVVVVLAIANLWKTTATKAELGDLEGRMDERFNVERLATKRDTDRIHERIDDLVQAQGQVTGELKQIGKNVDLLVERGMSR